DIIQGLFDGFKSMESSLYSKAQSIADNIAKTIQDALDIHSPSRVMFKLGDFTMQGFQDGLESLYKPIESSLKGFSVNLQTAPTLDVGNYRLASPPNFDDMYKSNNETVSRYMAQYNTQGNYNNGYGQDFSQTDSLLMSQNQLLRQQNDLLEKILNKPTIGDDEIGKRSVKYIQGEERRLQKSLVGLY
ncbi:MAG: hypothetical protein NC548_65815, partial [Lachnospiraceae bacterium]|nr:hypothetical protein [Lachnospiraceae bacterium]